MLAPDPTLTLIVTPTPTLTPILALFPASTLTPSRKMAAYNLDLFCAIFHTVPIRVRVCFSEADIRTPSHFDMFSAENTNLNCRVNLTHLSSYRGTEKMSPFMMFTAELKLLRQLRTFLFTQKLTQTFSRLCRGTEIIESVTMLTTIFRTFLTDSIFQFRRFRGFRGVESDTKVLSLHCD
jgi:hypothetical protein